MRFARLTLEKYGHLTNVGLDLPSHSPDLHIVIGANEAGKSTAQAALADLLYGFGHTTDYAFLHDMRDLRVGAFIESDGKSAAVWRRKARASSLQDDAGNPLDDRALDAFLAGVDRETFNQQFSLNHVRLRAGGEAILDANNDLGRMLLQAGAGLDWLTERLQQLEEESAELFKPAGSKQALAKALREREAALKKKKEATISVKAFKEAQAAESEARRALDEQSARREAILSERTKLERARRVIPILRKIDQYASIIATLASTPLVSADFTDIFEKAVKAHEEARQQVETAQHELKRAEQAHDAVVVDETLLAKEGEIGPVLGVLRSRYLTAEEDLPKRSAEMRVQETAILTLARDVGRPDMTADNVAEYLPTRPQIGTLRRLAGEANKHLEAVNNADEAFRKADKEVEAAQRAVDAFGQSVDVSQLRDAIATASADPGLDTRIEQAEKQAAAIRNDLAKRIAKLAPAAPEGVRRSLLPSSATVSQFMAEVEALDSRLKKLHEERLRLQGARLNLNTELESLISAGGAVPLEQLEQARAWRDRGWELIRRRFIDGRQPNVAGEQEFSADRPIGDTFADAIARADAVADARFAAAETSGKLVAKRADLDGANANLEDVSNTFKKTEAERTALLSRWQEQWRNAGIAAENPAHMAKWLSELEEIEARQIDLQDVKGTLVREQDAERRYREALVAALVKLGEPEPDRSEVLFHIRKRAQDIQSTLEQMERDRLSAIDKLKQLTGARDLAATALNRANAALESWRQNWSAQLVAWSLPDGAEPADVESVLGAWESIRTAHDKLDGEQGLHHRINTMKTDQERFADRLEEILAIVAPDLRALPKLRAAQELEQRLKIAQSNRELKASAARNVATRSEAHSEAVDAENLASATVNVLLQEIGAETLAAAKPVLDRIQERQQAERTLVTLREDLQQAGNGLTEAALRAECAGLEFDSLDGQIARHEAEDKIVFAEVQRLGGILGERGAELASFMQASAKAADAAEEAERASADASRVAERYVRLQTTSAILRYAIDRYRKENEGPLLRRASELFRELTLQKYAGLEIDYDSGDKPCLFARQASDGASVPVKGLSDGARDQLFLALRVAGVEELIARGANLPFVADDLFINFDDHRAAAGLTMIARLATHTQVLFFTHHTHLLELARKAIPQQFNEVRIA